MKHIHFLLICCSIIALCMTGCEKVTDQENTVMQGTEIENISESASDTTVVIDDLELHIPSSWTICGYTMLSDDTPVITIDICDFDEEKLKKEFQYKNTEECIKSLLPNGIYLQNESADIKNVNGFLVYEFVCTADKYSVSEDMFVMSDDVVYLDYLVQSDKDKVYCLYFMHDMAEKEKVESIKKRYEKQKIILIKMGNIDG